jgi:uncharacterized protein (TIGR03000 family)
MLRKLISYGGVMLLAGAALFGTPASSQAQHHGGGHAGGFHTGGFHAGGFHGGDFHGGGFHGGGFHGGDFNRDFHGGFSRDFHGGFHRGFGNFGLGYGYGYYPYYYGGYNAYPSYYYGGYSYDPYSYAWPGVTDDSGYDGSYGSVTPSDSNGSPSVGSLSYYAPATDTSASVTVKVPEGARLWFNGTPMTATGSVREFTSPPLTPGRRYSYEVQARWNENGREMTQTQDVEVRAGAHVNVDFPMQPTKAPTAPSH